MRTFRTRSARARSLIVIVTIRAIHEARNGLRCEQAGHIGIFSSSFNGMKRRIAARKFQPRVRLHKLTRHLGWPTGKTVGVATIAKLIFFCERFHNGSGGGNSRQTRQRTGRIWSRR